MQDLGSIFGYQVTGLWWGVLILSISTYPYVFILANESFNKFGVNQINASRGLGVGPWSSFFKIAFPMALPALITGISLMCMEVMNELGTFALLNIPSISTGIAENWIIEGNPKSAIGLSLVALLIIFTLIIFEKFFKEYISFKVVGTHSNLKVEKKNLAEELSTKSFYNTFKGVNFKNVEDVFLTLKEKHPYYNGKIHPKIKKGIIHILQQFSNKCRRFLCILLDKMTSHTKNDLQSKVSIVS